MLQHMKQKTGLSLNERIKRVENAKRKLFSIDTIIPYVQIGQASAKPYPMKAGKKAKLISQTDKQGLLLSRLCEFSKPNTILELGTGFGIGAMYLSAGNPDAEIYSIEGNIDIANIATTTLQELHLNQIHVINGLFDQVLPELLKELKQLDLIFIDGNHEENATLQYVNSILPYLSDKGIIILHDISWSSGMYNAWRKLCMSENYTVTVDVFSFGLLCVDKNLSKQHFIIRV